MKKLIAIAGLLLASELSYSQLVTYEVKVQQTNGFSGIGTLSPTSTFHIFDNQPTLKLQSSVNNALGSRIRFTEGSTFQGGFFHYDGDGNILNIGMHHGENEELTSDFNAISILRTNRYVGIGTSSPFQKLTVADGQVFFGHTSTNQVESGRLRFSEYMTSFQGAFIHYNGSDNTFNIGVHHANDTNSANDSNSISIRRDNGNVGIKRASPNYTLDINGSLNAASLYNSGQLQWSDFVFDTNYELRTLEEVEKHIEEKGHLPEVPSEAEILKEGYNIGNMDAKLLQKIEELTLYLIEQNKKIEELEKKVKELEKD